MNPPARAKRFLRSVCAGIPAFSLTEVVIALGIVSFALIAVVGIIPVGLSSLKDSVSDTHISLLLTNVRAALEEQEFKSGQLDSLYFDSSAQYQGKTSGINSYFCVDVSLAPPNQSIPKSQLLVATVRVTWPFELPIDKRRSYITSFLVTPLTGTGWQTLDPTFQPKIGL